MLIQTLEKMFEARSQRVEAAKTVQRNSVLSLRGPLCGKQNATVFGVFFTARECVTSQKALPTCSTTGSWKSWKKLRFKTNCCVSQAEKVVVDSSASVTRVRARKSSELFFVVFRMVLLQKLNQGAPRVEKTDEEH